MRLVNTYNKLRENWYSWTVSVKGTPQELNQINHVTYLLHKSFPRTRIVSKNASNNFAKTSEGWGEFLLRAEAATKSGEIKKASLWLDLGFEHTAEHKQQYNGDFE